MRGVRAVMCVQTALASNHQLQVRACLEGLTDLHGWLGSIHASFAAFSSGRTKKEAKHMKRPKQPKRRSHAAERDRDCDQYQQHENESQQQYATATAATAAVIATTVTWAGGGGVGVGERGERGRMFVAGDDDARSATTMVFPPEFKVPVVP